MIEAVFGRLQEVFGVCCFGGELCGPRFWSPTFEPSTLQQILEPSSRKEVDASLANAHE